MSPTHLPTWAGAITVACLVHLIILHALNYPQETMTSATTQSSYSISLISLPETANLPPANKKLDPPPRKAIPEPAHKPQPGMPTKPSARPIIKTEPETKPKLIESPNTNREGAFTEAQKTSLTRESDDVQSIHNSSQPGPDLLENYYTKVSQLLSSNKKYPRMALRRRQEGLVTVKIMVQANGSASMVAIIKASPFSTLNRAALQLVQQSSPFPEPPENASFPLEIIVPIKYELRE